MGNVPAFSYNRGICKSGGITPRISTSTVRLYEGQWPVSYQFHFAPGENSFMYGLTESEWVPNSVLAL